MNGLEEQSRADRGWVTGAVVLFAGLSLWAGIASTGFIEADACTHYLYSRFCLTERHLLTNVWGRPFCTGIYALPAVMFGRAGVRVFSLIMALVIGWITYGIARRQGYRDPGLAPVFLLGQPLVFLHSFAELTELPFALLVALAFRAYQEKKWVWFAALAGLMPTARPEGFGFVALAAVALTLHRRWWLVPLLGVPLLAWSVTGWVQFGMVGPWYRKVFTWLPENWPYADRSLYDPGPLWHFVWLLPAIVSPVVFPGLVAGIWRSVEAKWDGLFGEDHRTRCQVLIAVLPLLVLAGHSLLYWTGRMASNGEARYMLVVAPFWALLTAYGWEWAFDQLRMRHAVRWAVIAALLPFGVNWVYRVVPFQMTRDWVRAREVAEFYRANPWADDYPIMMATHSGLYYALDVSPTNKGRCAEWSLKTVIEAPHGVMAIWDSESALYNSDASRAVTVQEMARNGWVAVKVFPRVKKKLEGTGPVAKLAESIQTDEVGEWVVLLSPKDVKGRETPKEWGVQSPSTRGVKPEP